MLVPRDLFREFTDLNSTFDRVFNQMWNGERTAEGILPLDIAETEDGFVVKASVPGLDPDDVDITFSNNVLSIRGEVKPDEDVDSSRYYLQERWYGRFQRSLTLPSQIDVDDIQANYEAGVLTLFLPKSEEARPKRIQIQAGAQPKAIESRVREAAS